MLLKVRLLEEGSGDLAIVCIWTVLKVDRGCRGCPGDFWCVGLAGNYHHYGGFRYVPTGDEVGHGWQRGQRLK